MVGSTCSVAGLRAGVGHLHGHQQVIRAGLGVVHLDDPVPVLIEHPGIQQFILGLLAAARRVLINEVLVRERGLRIVIPPAVPHMARQRVEIPPVLLDVLAVVALRPGQAERPLLQDRVLAVPQRQAQAQPLFDVAEPGQAILTPPVGARPRLIVRQVVPRLAVRAVVLPDRAPLALADVRPPPVPFPGLPQPVLQPPEPGHPIPLRAHCQPLSFFGVPQHPCMPPAHGLSIRANTQAHHLWRVMIPALLSITVGRVTHLAGVEHLPEPKRERHHRHMNGWQII